MVDRCRSIRCQPPWQRSVRDLRVAGTCDGVPPDATTKPWDCGATGPTDKYVREDLSPGGTNPAWAPCSPAVAPYRRRTPLRHGPTRVRAQALSTWPGVRAVYGVAAVHGRGNVRAATIFPDSIALGETRSSRNRFRCPPGRHHRPSRNRTCLRSEATRVQASVQREEGAEPASEPSLRNHHPRCATPVQQTRLDPLRPCGREPKLRKPRGAAPQDRAPCSRLYGAGADLCRVHRLGPGADLSRSTGQEDEAERVCARSCEAGDAPRSVSAAGSAGSPTVTGSRGVRPRRSSRRPR